MADPKKVFVKLNYSRGANYLISKLKDFDIEDFEEYCLNHIAVGTRSVLEYLEIKRQEQSKDLGG